MIVNQIILFIMETLEGTLSELSQAGHDWYNVQPVKILREGVDNQDIVSTSKLSYRILEKIEDLGQEKDAKHFKGILSAKTDIDNEHFAKHFEANMCERKKTLFKATMQYKVEEVISLCYV